MLAAPAAGRIAILDTMHCIARQLTEASSKNPRCRYQRLAITSIHEHEALRLKVTTLLRATRLGGYGDGLAEQLEVVRDLPDEEQSEAASSLVQAWRGQLSAEFALCVCRYSDI